MIADYRSFTSSDLLCIKRNVVVMMLLTEKQLFVLSLTLTAILNQKKKKRASGSTKHAARLT